MKNKKKILLITIVVVVAVISVIAVRLRRGGDASTASTQPVDTVPVLVTRMEQCSRLYTSEYQLRKILIYDNPATLSGSFLHQDFNIHLPLGKRRIAIPVTATAKAYVDMSKLTADDVQRHGDRLEITLPDPQVTLTATAIDHKGVRQKVSLLRRNFTDEEITHIQQQGRKEIISNLEKTNIIEDARSSAARQIIPIAVALGFKEENITVTFRRNLTPHSLARLLE